METLCCRWTLQGQDTSCSWWTHPLSHFTRSASLRHWLARACSCDLPSRAMAPCFCLGLDCQVPQSSGQPHFLPCPRLWSTILAFTVKAVLFLIWLYSRNSYLYLARSWEFSRMGPVCSIHSFVEPSGWTVLRVHPRWWAACAPSHLGSSASRVSCGCQG